LTVTTFPVILEITNKTMEGNGTQYEN
jgi:hypothetical protein